ncbi:Hypothetical protein PHPALM_17257 [Phytophthora palmivora]|uniref:Uncharacterized protein n=1 Tax=Phytophthora palmivora TaxID=4796 RepID=A0A2P4XMP2_9STRA|nr:Hypothetical protein PHPALM_17257 [Phytophthora palmivora]
MGTDMNASIDNGSECGRTSCALDPQPSAKKVNLAWLTDAFSGGIAEFDEEEKISLYLGDAQGTPVTSNPLKWWTKERRNFGAIRVSVFSKRKYIVRDIMFVGENYEENDDNIPSGENNNSDDDSE